MHGKAVVIDGKTAFVLGSTLADRISAPKIITLMMHGMGVRFFMTSCIKVEGPAVEHVDRSFTTLWNAADSSGIVVVTLYGAGSC